MSPVAVKSEESEVEKEFERLEEKEKEANLEIEVSKTDSGEMVVIEAEPGYREFLQELEQNKSRFFNRYISSGDFEGGVQEYNRFLFEYSSTAYGAEMETVENEAYLIEDFEGELKSLYE